MTKVDDARPLPGYTSKAHGFWSKDNMRLHFEAFAKVQNLDPLDQATWQNITHKRIKETKVYPFSLFLSSSLALVLVFFVICFDGLSLTSLNSMVIQFSAR